MPLSDLLERFRRGPELLAVVLTGVFGEEEDFVTAPGQWSIRQADQRSIPLSSWRSTVPRCS